MAVSREAPRVSMKVGKEQSYYAGLGGLCSSQPPPSCIRTHSHAHGGGWDVAPGQDGKLGVPSLARGWELLFNWVEP